MIGSFRMKTPFSKLLLSFVFCVTAQIGNAAPNVLSDIAPTHSLVSMVIGDVGESTLLINSSSSPHDFSLRPSDAGKISRAEIIFFTGSTLTPWLIDAMASLADNTPTVELISTSGTTLLEFRESNIFEGDSSHDHSGHNHDSSASYDPHAWLDPSNAQLWLNRISEELSAIDPDNARTYAANAAAAIVSIQETSDKVKESIKKISNTQYIVFHDSYHYFESYFDIHAAAAINLGDGTLPSISQISQLKKLLKDSDAACVFSEPQFSQRLVDTVAEGSDVKRGVLDPIGVNLPPDANLYPSLIESLADELLRCLAT